MMSLETMRFTRLGERIATPTNKMMTYAHKHWVWLNHTNGFSAHPSCDTARNPRADRLPRLARPSSVRGGESIMSHVRVDL